ncbi:hypothetical protein [uncultured Mediterranean phage uvMED]|nr:hypothetical protein [uncultured Mediterranean phage uvMED]
MDGKNEIISACWGSDCYVYYKPVEQGKNKMVKLEMDLQGNVVTGKELYKQNSKEIIKKIVELYEYIYKNYVT